jgi:hypothetical protein
LEAALETLGGWGKPLAAPGSKGGPPGLMAADPQVCGCAAVCYLDICIHDVLGSCAVQLCWAAVLGSCHSISQTMYSCNLHKQLEPQAAKRLCARGGAQVLDAARRRFGSAAAAVLREWRKDPDPATILRCAMQLPHMCG